MPRLLGAYAISDEDLRALPVRDLEAMIDFYTRVMAFTVSQRDDASAIVERDDVQLGLIVRDDHDPGRAGSVAIEVDDLVELHAELARSGGEPGVFGEDEWNDRMHRTFFVREGANGYCYCFFCTLTG